MKGDFQGFTQIVRVTIYLFWMMFNEYKTTVRVSIQFELLYLAIQKRILRSCFPNDLVNFFTTVTLKNTCRNYL